MNRIGGYIRSSTDNTNIDRYNRASDIAARYERNISQTRTGQNALRAIAETRARGSYGNTAPYEEAARMAEAEWERRYSRRQYMGLSNG